MPDKLPPDDLKYVWQNQREESVDMSLEEIRRRADRFQKRISRRNLREFAAGIIVVAAFGYFLHIPNVYIRVASALTIAGALYVMYYMLTHGSGRSAPADAPSTACLDFHRSELVRQRDLLRNVWKWYLAPLVPGQIVFILGGLVEPGHPRMSAAIHGLLFALVFWGIAKLNSQAARKLQEEIDSLDAIGPASM